MSIKGRLFLLLSAAGVAFLVLSTSCAIRTPPFMDLRGQKVPGSVATMTEAAIGGLEQRLWFQIR